MKHPTGFLALVLFTALPLSAADLSDLTYTTTGGEVTITDCDTAATGELIIPDTIEGNPVTRIFDLALRGCISITSVVIPDSVTFIGLRAFSGCTSLASITIPDSVTNIGPFAFDSCIRLTGITIPVGVTSIAGGAFNDCFNLTNVTIPDSVTSIGGGAFSACRALRSITIPDSITSIGPSAFSQCASLTSITIPDSVTSIGSYAFNECSSLTGVTIPSSVTSIGESTFTECSSLATVTIPNGVTGIGRNAFLRCSSLTSVTLPDSVTSVGTNAFRDCTSLASITFTGPVPATLGQNIFDNTAAGAVVIVPNGFLAGFGEIGATWNGLIIEVSRPEQLTWTTTGNEVTITDCDTSASGILVIPDTIEGNPVTGIGRAAFENCASLTSITIPDSVTSIGDRAFASCSSLTSITISDGVTSIGAGAFDGCPAVIEIHPVTQNQLAAQLAAVTAERDAILGDIQLAYDEVVGRKGAAEEDLVAVAPTSSATIFDLVWMNSGDPTDTIAMTIEFPEDSVANPVEFGFGTSVQGSVLTIDYQGTVTVINDPTIVFNSPVELDFSQELMGQNGFGATAGQFGSGDFNLFGVEVPEGTFTGQNYFTLGAPDGSAYILTSMLAPVTSRFSSLELNPLTELYAFLVAANEGAIAERDAATAERDARPTTEELAAAEAERDARFTEDQIRALSADYTIGLNNAGNVQMKFNLFESADLSTFAPLTLNPDSVSVVDGSICLEFAPEDRAAFFRFNVE